MTLRPKPTRRSKPRTSSRALAAALAALAALAAGPARAGGEATADGPPPGTISPEALETARRLFEEGQVHYSLGEYDQAIARFRRAYEISSAPALLFDIAQAYRLKGECRQALEIYRHFARQVPDSPHRDEAEGQIRSLEARCSPALPAAVPVPTPAPAATTPTPPPPPAPEPAPAPKTHARLVVALLAAGVGLGLGTGALYLWNDGRYNRWSGEDSRLAVPLNSQTPPPSAWIARQNANDSLLRSIRDADFAVAILGGLSAACLLGSAVAGLVPATGPSLQASSRELQLAWRLTWP